MFDELLKYSNTGHFLFRAEDSLMKVCNAPTDKSGIYIVYALAKNKVDLIYIGCSGKKGSDGNIQTRTAGCGGIKDRIVNGKHFNKVARRKSWPSQMLLENLEVIDVYWYVTYDAKNFDFPEDIEGQLLKKYKDIFGHLPKWNKR